MIYKKLPPVGKGMSHLPELHWVPTEACSSRFGAPIQKVWVHRWGVKYTNEHNEALSYRGVIREFKNPANQASAHFIYPGSAMPDHCTQMVAKAKKSWTESTFNRTGISVESADAIWLGDDPDGFVQLARITAFLLHDNGLPPNWVHGFTFARKGFLRHADGGALAGGHTQCPTTDMQLWGQLISRVRDEHRRGGFRKVWSR